MKGHLFNLSLQDVTDISKYKNICPFVIIKLLYYDIKNDIIY